MSYLRCSKCNWSQDDFWSENYNPFTCRHRNHRDALLKEDLDAPWHPDLCAADEEAVGISGDLPWREVLARKAEQDAATIRNMRWRTKDDWVAAGSPGCPECGSPLRED